MKPSKDTESTQYSPPPVIISYNLINQSPKDNPLLRLNYRLTPLTQPSRNIQTGPTTETTPSGTPPLVSIDYSSSLLFLLVTPRHFHFLLNSNYQLAKPSMETRRRERIHTHTTSAATASHLQEPRHQFLPPAIALGLLCGAAIQVLLPLLHRHPRQLVSLPLPLPLLRRHGCCRGCAEVVWKECGC